MSRDNEGVAVDDFKDLRHGVACVFVHFEFAPFQFVFFVVAIYIKSPSAATSYRFGACNLCMELFIIKWYNLEVYTRLCAIWLTICGG